MMRVMTALGRFKSSGLSAISLPTQRLLKPNAPGITAVPPVNGSLSRGLQVGANQLAPADDVVLALAT